METKANNDSKPVVGQIEDHMAGGKYQPCRWTGSSWAPVAPTTRKPVNRGVCPRCHSYCYGDCQS